MLCICQHASFPGAGVPIAGVLQYIKLDFTLLTTPWDRREGNIASLRLVSLRSNAPPSVCQIYPQTPLDPSTHQEIRANTVIILEGRTCAETNSSCTTACTVRERSQINALSGSRILVHRDENAEHDSNEHREGHRLDEYAQTSGGEDPLRQRALNGKISHCAWSKTSTHHPSRQF